MVLTQVLFVGIVTLCVWEVGVAGADSCDPSCPEECTPGEKVPNPRYCHQYYLCLDDCVPSDNAYDCAEDHVFDPISKACAEDNPVGSIPCDICTPRCHYSCDSNVECIVDRKDCTVCYLCAFDPPVMFECPYGSMFFNGIECTDDSAMCCDPCQVYCEVPFTEILDPTSCTHYYMCTQVGFPLPEDRYECGHGEVFLDGHCTASMNPYDCYQPCAE